jgi:hypothetical protein
MNLDPAKTRVVVLLILLVVAGSAALYDGNDSRLRWGHAILAVLAAAVLASTWYRARKRR